MSVRSRSRPVALFLSLVPGWGFVYWGREQAGLSIFTIFAVAGFCLLNGLYIYFGAGRRSLIALALLVLVGITLWNWVKILRLTSPGRVRAHEEQRMISLRNGMISYLRSDTEAAKKAFLTCIDADPGDVEALFRLGVVCARSGDPRSARAWLRRARKHDLEDKWIWELEREMKRLQPQGTVQQAESRGPPDPAKSRQEAPGNVAIGVKGSRPKILQPPAPS